MAKYSFVMLMAILATLAFQASAWPTWSKSSKCPDVRGMENFSFSQMNAYPYKTWYPILFNSDPDAPMNVSCVVSRMTQLGGSRVLHETFYKYEGQFKNKSKEIEFNADPSRHFQFDEEHEVKGFLWNENQTIDTGLKVIWTDYYGIMLSYSCVELDHYWPFGTEVKENFYISVTDRNFNDWNAVYNALLYVHSLGFDMNEVQRIFQNDCMMQYMW